MADNECKIVRMKSSDEQIFEVEEAVALKSQTIKDMVGEIGNESIVPLYNVSAKTLAKVIEYCRYHVDANDETETSTPAVKMWDEDFFKVSQDELYHLIMKKQRRAKRTRTEIPKNAASRPTSVVFYGK